MEGEKVVQLFHFVKTKQMSDDIFNFQLGIGEVLCIHSAIIQSLIGLNPRDRTFSYFL